MKHQFFYLLFFVFFLQALSLIPPRFQWKTMDFAWENNEMRRQAIEKGDYIPVNNMPGGLARWKDKLFVTIPRLKAGVPSCLNFLYLNGTQEQPLNPYPSWKDSLMAQNGTSKSTVVCAFKIFVDSCDRLWVIDNGVTNLTGQIQHIRDPAIMVFDLTRNQLTHTFTLGQDIVKDTSVYTSIVVDKPSKSCHDVYAYITDMGSNAIVVFSLKSNSAWRFENPYFHFDENAGAFKVGGVEFNWKDGISSSALANLESKGKRNLYFHPTASTKQFVLSTELLKNKNTTEDEMFNGVQIVGDRGPKSQATACDYDLQKNVLYYTQLSKNGVGCWNTDKPFNKENNALIFSDCNMLEFPIDLKMDQEGNVWLLSNRQSRFLYGVMDFNDVNFRILTAPSSLMIQGSTCQKQSMIKSLTSLLSRPCSAKK